MSDDELAVLEAKEKSARAQFEQAKERWLEIVQAVQLERMLRIVRMPEPVKV